MQTVLLNPNHGVKFLIETAIYLSLLSLHSLPPLLLVIQIKKKTEGPQII